MAQAIRTLTVDHGLEPNDFSLLAFGGAGPMHAAFIAAEIGIENVVVPKFPGAFSAWGMLEADVRRDFAQQFFATRETLEQRHMHEAVKALGAQAVDALMVQDMTEDRITVEHFVDMRYESQDSTLTIPLSDLDILAEDFQEQVEKRFSDAHLRRYGHATPGAPVQYVALRTTGLGKVNRADAEVDGSGPENARVDTLPVYFDGAEQQTAFIDREKLSPGDTFTGPAIVFEPTSTTVVPPRCTCTVDDNEFILMTVPTASTTTKEA
jgi:N-methylhydantoinase A